MPNRTPDTQASLPPAPSMQVPPPQLTRPPTLPTKIEVATVADWGLKVVLPLVLAVCGGYALNNNFQYRVVQVEDRVKTLEARFDRQAELSAAQSSKIERFDERLTSVLGVITKVDRLIDERPPHHSP